MDPLLLLAALLTGGAALLLIVALGSYLRGDRRLSTRMDLYLGTGIDPHVLPAHVSDTDEGQIAGRLNSALNEVGFAEGIRRALARADLPLTVPEYILLKVAAALLPTALVIVITRSLLVAPLIALLGFFLPTLWLRRRRRHRQRLFAEQLPDMLSTLIGSLRGGFSLAQSLGNVANEAPVPLGVEMRRVMQELQLGLGIGEALDNLARRMESDDLDLVVAVIRINARIGGNLTTVLENINTTIRERTRLQRAIRVITSQQRFASYILGLLPIILGMILMTINPDYMLKLCLPGPTLIIPVVAGVCNLAGFILIQRMVDIKV